MSIGKFEMKHKAAPKQVVNSSGGITPSEKEEATRLLDSVKGTYMDRLYKRTGRFDPEQRKVVFENVPMSEEENLAEWNREKGEYYVDFDKSGKRKSIKYSKR